MTDFSNESPCYRPRVDPSSRRWGPILAAGVAASLGLVALSASGSEGAGLSALDAGADFDGGADAGVLIAAPAPVPASQEPSAAEVAAADKAAAEAGEGEAEFANFPVPSFEGLAAIPAEKDFLSRAVLKDGRYVLEGASPRTLTIDPRYQRALTALLRSYQVPYGAIAAIEPTTGRVLALAEYSHDAPELRGLPVKAVYPAASVYKIVTGAALLAAGVSPEESVCYHGGKRRLKPKLLEDSKRDGLCTTLSRAMAHSTNVVFGKLAKRKLDAKTLRAFSERFGFNTPLDFAQPTDVSVARIPDDTYEMAKTAAGFGEVFLSPLHGALIAAAVANKGVQMSPVLFEGEASQRRRILDEATAAALVEMLEKTVTEGTGRRAFRERGRYALGSHRAIGKTGSIHDKKPFRDFTWFVGSVTKESPKVAVAAVVVNGPLWRVHAPYLGREALRLFLEPPAEKRAKAKGSRRARR